MNIYKDGDMINLAHRRERRSKYRPTWPYYLTLIAFAVLVAWAITKYL